MKTITALILCLCMIFSLSGCKLSEDPISEEELKELFNQVPEENADDKGSVYYLNLNYDTDEAWQALASSYTEQTGIPVKVVSPEPGKYDEVFEAEMNKLCSPTLFHSGSRRAEKWGDYCLDLNGSPVLSELAFEDFVIKDDHGAVNFIAYRTESYGLIVNKRLLGDAGYSLEEIADFEGLKAAAELVHEQSIYLGYDAFAPLPMGSSVDLVASRLANIPLYYEFRDKQIAKTPETVEGTYLDMLKAVWDLCTGFSPTAANELVNINEQQAEAEFAEGRAVFYLGNAKAYDRLITAGMASEDLAVIPIYCGASGEDKAALCMGPTDFLAVNNEADEKDIQATLDFMYWLVTSEEGLKMMMDNFGVIPFNSSIHSGNAFDTRSASLVLEGSYPILPVINLAPSADEYIAGLSDALRKYSAGSGSWDQVVTAFTQGWAAEHSTQ